nr:phosphotransferase [Neobacillus sp. Marseille-Q6967]
MTQVDTYFTDILSHYFPAGSWDIRAGNSGANNTTRFVTVQNENYVLRIYETHQDEEKVMFEHAVLTALGNSPTRFSIPELILTKGKHTIVKTPDGKIASLFRYLEGTNPSLEDPIQIQSYGKIVGELTFSLEKLKINQNPVYRPYYELESSHPRCPLDKVIRFCMSPSAELTELKPELRFIASRLNAFQEYVPSLIMLPHQLVHGDLNGSNILINKKGLVTSILDFEFTTYDLRVMELGVCLSDFIRPSLETTWVMERIEAFLEGYGSVLKLTENEINLLPVLVELRSLDVFIHFLGRYWDQIEPSDILKATIKKAVKRSEWLQENQGKLLSLSSQNLM